MREKGGRTRDGRRPLQFPAMGQTKVVDLRYSSEGRRGRTKVHFCGKNQRTRI